MPDYRYAFISHAHGDNPLCDPYSAALTRLGVPHYYDRTNPQVGHDIGEALERELQRAQALIVLASPKSLASVWVREEINIFFVLMMRDPTRLLIPVKVAPCELPPRLEARWWVDSVGRPVEQVVAELAHALEISAPQVHSGQQLQEARPTQPEVSLLRQAGLARRIRVVDTRPGMGNHTTISEAIAAAHPLDYILVRKGVYEGSLIIDKQLEIVGDGQPGNVEVRGKGSCIIFKTSQGRVANLTLRQTDGVNLPSVAIRKGRLELEDCDISSEVGSGVVIRGDADPVIRRCRIHACRSAGLLVYGHGKGLIEDCDIFANTFNGVTVAGGGAPTVRNCRINKNGAAAVRAYARGGGVYEQNDLRDNTEGAWSIESSSVGNVTCRDNIER